MPADRPATEKRSKVGDLELIVRYRQAPSPALQEQIYLRYRGLIQYLAVKFVGRGEAMDDLRQVASIGLLKAVERFDVERGCEFVSFATPTIVGEIKRHLRDRSSLLRAPRHLTEVKNAAAAASEKLTHELGRSPTVAELAAVTAIAKETLLLSQEADAACRTVSLDWSQEGEDDSAVRNLHVFLGAVDLGYGEVEDQVALERALVELTLRERVVVYLRFHHCLSQAETAHFLGVSQMQISRLQKRATLRLKETLTEGTRSAWAKSAGAQGVAPSDPDIAEIMLQWLLREADLETDSHCLAAGVIRLCDRLRERLAQVIGREGARAMFAHTRVRYNQGLPKGGIVIPPIEGSEADSAGFESLLGDLEPRALQDTAVTFLVILHTLLGALIGEKLALEILRGPDPLGLLDKSVAGRTRH